MFGRLRHRAWHLEAVTQRANLLVGDEQRLVTLVDVGLALRAVQVFASDAVAECDTSVELSTVQEGVRAVTDTRRVVVALVIVGECTPFRADVDTTLRQNQTATRANHISTRVILVEVRRVLLALPTDHPHVQVLAPFIVLFLLHHRLYDLSG
jgi:hypothetical protein